MTETIKVALEDDSCRKDAEDFLSFVYKDLVCNSPNRFIARRVMQQIGKSNPKTVKATIHAFHRPSRELAEAAKILGIEIKLSVESPF